HACGVFLGPGSRPAAPCRRTPLAIPLHKSGCKDTSRREVHCMDRKAPVQRKSSRLVQIGCVRRCLTALALLACLLAACQRFLPPPEPPPYQGVTLRIACPSSLGELFETQSRP